MESSTSSATEPSIALMLLSAFLLAWLGASLMMWMGASWRLLRNLPILPAESRPSHHVLFSDILFAVGVFLFSSVLLAPLMMGMSPNSEPAQAANVDDEQNQNSTSGIDDSPAPEVSAEPSDLPSGDPRDGAVSADRSSPSQAETRVESNSSTDIEGAAKTSGAADPEGATLDAPEFDLASQIPLLLLQALATSISITATLAWIGLRKIPLQEYGFAVRLRDLWVGIGATAMILPPIFAIQSILVNYVLDYSHPLIDVLQQPQSITVVLLMGLCSAIVAPITEEFFFRGFIQSWLQSFHSRALSQDSAHLPIDAATVSEAATTPSPLIPHDTEFSGSDAAYLPPKQFSVESPSKSDETTVPYWPIVITSLMFSAVHMGQGPAPISLFFLSLGLGYLYRQTGRIWAGVFVHMFLNAFTTFMTMFAQ